jgi:hypothetical protein
LIYAEVSITDNERRNESLNYINDKIQAYTSMMEAAVVELESGRDSCHTQSLVEGMLNSRSKIEDSESTDFPEFAQCANTFDDSWIIHDHQPGLCYRAGEGQM